MLTRRYFSPLRTAESAERKGLCQRRSRQNQGAKNVSDSKKQQMRIRQIDLEVVLLVQMACFSLLFPLCDSFLAMHPFISGQPIHRKPHSIPLVGHHHGFLRNSKNQAAWPGASPSSGASIASRAAMLKRMARVCMQSQGGEGKGPILLIGGTGRVGGFVAQGLVTRGERVRALVRDVNSPRCQALKDACRGARGDIEIVEGDVAKFATVEKAMAGCRACIACHGSVRETNILKDSAYKIWDPKNMFLGE
jgi:hypothetical protein